MGNWRVILPLLSAELFHPTLELSNDSFMSFVLLAFLALQWARNWHGDFLWYTPHVHSAAIIRRFAHVLSGNSERLVKSAWWLSFNHFKWKLHIYRIYSWWFQRCFFEFWPWNPWNLNDPSWLTSIFVRWVGSTSSWSLIEWSLWSFLFQRKTRQQLGHLPPEKAGLMKIAIGFP